MTDASRIMAPLTDLLQAKTTLRAAVPRQRAGVPGSHLGHQAVPSLAGGSTVPASNGQQGPILARWIPVDNVQAYEMVPAATRVPVHRRTRARHGQPTPERPLQKPRAQHHASCSGRSGPLSTQVHQALAVDSYATTTAPTTASPYRRQLNPWSSTNTTMTAQQATPGTRKQVA
ncbi:hypothetical protein QE152_g4365 [Popillia japonica]|uniref:Uncharacterized protein n=1 Tax=Popillia japonica TaxID=7064 RepID=A0AAW1N0Z7_POPJA